MTGWLGDVADGLRWWWLKVQQGWEWLWTSTH